MSLSSELLDHAFRLLGDSWDQREPEARKVDWRRAVSAAYYSLFHHLSEAVVRQVAPDVSIETANQIHRWLDHAEMKRISAEFAATQLRQPLRGLLGATSSSEMQTVANAFIRLQQARHSADYDLAYKLSWVETRELLQAAVDAVTAWEAIAHTSESNIFILSLLLWKKWELARH